MLESCEICEGSEFKLIATKIREGAGQIMKCAKCGLLIQNLDWDDNDLKQYYENEYQRTNSLVSDKIQTPKERYDSRLLTISPIFDQIKPLLNKNLKVLEVGCGSGALLSLIKPHVKKCVGVELYTPFVEFIKEELEIEAYAEDINQINIGDKFDLIISIATLDHLPNPGETLMTMRDYLTESGRLYIEVPNCDEALNHFLPEHNRLKYNEFFWHRAHMFYFNKDTLAALFKKCELNSKITSRHEYSLKNFLNWYFIGKPQPSFVGACNEKTLFDGHTDFEDKMNEMFSLMDRQFKSIMSDTYRGDSLCCTGYF
jgi:SAM-dependent methyltransferase